jgi:4-diphosphocytidyl-2-C-methyl-D-erythritol kinase
MELAERVSGAGQAQPFSACRRPTRRWLPPAADRLSLSRAWRQSALRTTCRRRGTPGDATAGVPPENDLTVRAARLLQAQPVAGRRRDQHRQASAARWRPGWRKLGCRDGLAGPQPPLAAWSAAPPAAGNRPAARRRRAGIRFRPQRLCRRHRRDAATGRAAAELVCGPRTAVQVPTAAIFGSPELKRDSLPIAVDAWRPAFGTNDLEAVACARFPVIAEHLAWLSRRGRRRA